VEIRRVGYPDVLQAFDKFLPASLIKTAGFQTATQTVGKDSRGQGFKCYSFTYTVKPISKML
jgi:hypothetical protein